MCWPPCMVEGCDAWPSLGFTGCCASCIKEPAKVQRVAAQMRANVDRFRERDAGDHELVCWLAHVPEKGLAMALEIIRGGEPDVRKAIGMARRLYWATLQVKEAP